MVSEVSEAAPAWPRGPTAVVRTVAEASLDQVWAAFVPVDLAQVFPRPKGPIPAVTGVSGQTGPWDVVGSARHVHLADGSRVREEILASTPCDGAAPSGGAARFAYRVAGFTGPLAALTDAAHGEWRFVADGPARTEITWRYTFSPRGWWVRPALALLVATVWRAYMADGLDNVRRLAEGAGPPVRPQP